jgi:tetratricopeptide (TPR) repeat protein
MSLRSYLIILIIVLAIVTPALAAVNLSDDSNETDNAWYWYNKAVDLANAGQFPQALAANEQALARNQEFPIAWANEAGILVQVGRYDDAIKAADNVLNSNRTGLPMKYTFAAAYYSKGDALRALGRINEAKANYKNASELDPSLTAPDLSSAVAVIVTVIPSPSATGTDLSATPPVKTQPTATKSPLPVAVSAGAVLVAFVCLRCRHSGQ